MTSFLRRVADRVGTFVYNARNAYYEYASDLRQVSGSQLVDVIERRERDGIALMNNLTTALGRGEISLNQWRDAMATEIRRGHSQAFALGRGGWRQMTVEDRRLISDRLKQEFKYLQQFGRDIADGKLSEKQIRARGELYERHFMASYWQGETEAKKASGYTQERRIMAEVHHCSDCPDYEAQGWQPIGTLPMPGDACECGANCKCSMEYE